MMIVLRYPGNEALERLKNQCLMLWPSYSAFNFDWIFFILAGNNGENTIPDEFFRPDPTTGLGSKLPLGVLKNPH